MATTREPFDDPSIGDGEVLLRHFPPAFWIHDKLTGNYRISSQAFTHSTRPPGGMSVNRENPMRADGLPPTHFLPDPSFGLARLRSGELRAIGLAIGATPLPGNPYHAEVWGIRKAVAKRLAEMAEIAKLPHGAV